MNDYVKRFENVNKCFCRGLKKTVQACVRVLWLWPDPIGTNRKMKQVTSDKHTRKVESANPRIIMYTYNTYRYIQHYTNMIAVVPDAEACPTLSTGKQNKPVGDWTPRLAQMSLTH